MAKLKTHKYENIILEAIQSNQRFQGNEELLEPIYNDVLDRLGNIADSISDSSVIGDYIQKVVKLSVINIIKQNKKTTRINNTSVADTTPAKTAPADYYSEFSYKPLETNNEIYVSKNDLIKIEQEILNLEKTSSNKGFLNLYSLRYTKGKSLEEISDDLNISQAQVAERLFEIAALVKRICGNEVSQV